jgi:hypothetical protein
MHIKGLKLLMNQQVGEKIGTKFKEGTIAKGTQFISKAVASACALRKCST